VKETTFTINYDSDLETEIVSSTYRHAYNEFLFNLHAMGEGIFGINFIKNEDTGQIYHLMSRAIFKEVK